MFKNANKSADAVCSSPSGFQIQNCKTQNYHCYHSFNVEVQMLIRPMTG